MQQWYNWLHEKKRKDEKKRREKAHQQLVAWMISYAWGEAGFLHRSTQPAAWRGGLQVLEEFETQRKAEIVGETLAVRLRVSKHGGQAVEELGISKLVRRTAKVERKRTSKTQRGAFKATTGVGCDGFHP